MKKILLLLLVASVMLATSCTKDEDLLVKDKDKDKVEESGNSIIRKYEVQRTDSVAIYIVKAYEIVGSETHMFEVGAKVDINIYTNEIRSKSQWTRPAIITKKL